MLDILSKGLGVAGVLLLASGLLVRMDLLMTAGVCCLVPEIGRWWWGRLRVDRLERAADDKNSSSGPVSSAVKKAGRFALNVAVPKEFRWAMSPGEAGKELRGLGSVTSSVAKSFVRRDKYRVEKFEDAVARFDLCEDDLRGLRLAYEKKGRLLSSGAYFCFAICLGALLAGRWLWVLSAFLSMELLLLLGAVSLFRAAQIKQRYFFPFSEYLRRFYLQDLNFMRWV